MNNKLKKVFILILISINLTITVLLFNVNIISILSSTYKRQVEKVVSLDLTSKDKLTIVNYLKVLIISGKESCSILENGNSAFSDIEITHLKDIVHILYFLRIILLISMILSILFLIKYKKQIFNIIITSIILTALIGLIIYLFFDYTFIIFHLISFKNTFWILNPKIHLLINIFPEEFFISKFVQLIILSVTELGLLMLIKKVYINLKHRLST
jgi:integral membrane protein (TIGR01906 family)